MEKSKLGVIYFREASDWALPFIQQIWKMAGGASSGTPLLLIGDDSLEANQVKKFNAPKVVSKIVAKDLIALERVAARIEGRSEAEADYCEELLTRPREELDPPPLLSGDDLIRHGVARGKIFAKLLRATRDAQLDDKIATREEAMELVDRLIAAE